MTDEIKPGDKLYYVPSGNRNGKPSWVTVQKVGRKWITLPYRMRCDKETLIVDGGDYQSPGRCYRSAEEYYESKHLSRIQYALQKWFGNYWQAGSLTADQCVQIAAIASIQLPERELVSAD